MDHTLDIYVTLRSPYSYLASRRMLEIARDVDVPIRFRPVYPIAIRIPDFFENNDPLWIPYLVRDTARVSEMNGIPFAWPKPDPIVQDMETRKISPHQPHIRRLTRLTMAAEEAGNGLQFYAAVSALIFSGVAWDEGDNLKDAAARSGHDLASLDAAIAADPEGYDARIAVNEAAQREAGHWGTPLFVFDGEPFFGQDRIDMCLWRMRQAGIGDRVK